MYDTGIISGFEEHRWDVARLNAQVEDLEQSDVGIPIFTHWSPSRDARALDPRHGASPVAPGFSTDLSGEACFRSEKVMAWAVGHTHFNCDFLVARDDGTGALRLFRNQRGYYFSRAMGFDGEKFLEGYSDTKNASTDSRAPGFVK